MSQLKIDTYVPALSDETIAAAEKAERLGFDGVWTEETSHDGFLPHALVAEHTERIESGTRIALSFTRSPMVLGYLAWDLARFSEGRFVLGLGTQVQAHNERRFSVEWESPSPRLREVIEALRHVWTVFQNEERELDYQGEYYSFSLMTDRFDPGPIADPDIPIYIAGVNEHNIRLAGERCDGLSLHSFNTPAYTNEVIQPLVEEGASRAGRSIDDVALSAMPFVVTGRTDEELERSREETRRKIAFYGSTPSYHDVFEHHGWTEVGPELHELSKRNEWDEMAGLVTDDILGEFAVEASPDDLLEATRRTYGDTVDRVALPFEFADEFMRG